MQKTARKRICEILAPARNGDRLSRWADIFIIGLISANVIAIILESVSSIYMPYARHFAWFEAVSVAVFTVEYLLRVWSSVEEDSGRYCRPLWGRLRYAATPLALIDLAAFLPFYLGMLMPVDLRFMRVLRLVRIFKLTRYSASMNLLLSVFREEARAFGAAFFILLILLIIASSGIYLFERQAQPEAFGSIPAAIWWAVATLTTVGYGDIIPVTPGGKIFGMGVMVVGIGMVALPAGILASAFSDHVHRRREDYEELVDNVMGDGVITAEEESALEKNRRELGLDSEEAHKILARAAREGLCRTTVCPHCGGSLFPTARQASNE